MESEKQVQNTLNMLISEVFETALSLVEEGIEDPRIQRRDGQMNMRIKVEGFSAKLLIDLGEARIEVSQDGKLIYGNRPFWVVSPATAKRVITMLMRELSTIYETAMIQRLKQPAASCEEGHRPRGATC